MQRRRPLSWALLRATAQHRLVPLLIFVLVAALYGSGGLDSVEREFTNTRFRIVTRAATAI